MQLTHSVAWGLIVGNTFMHIRITCYQIKNVENLGKVKFVNIRLLYDCTIRVPVNTFFIKFFLQV